MNQSAIHPIPASVPNDDGSTQGIALNVLIVEDSDEEFMLLQSTLKEGGFAPRCTRVDDMPALEIALGAGQWDIVIANHALAKIDAFEVLQHVRRYSADLSFIIVVHDLNEDVAVAAMRAGASDYVNTLNLKRLLPAIQRELLAAETRRQRQQARQVAKAAMEAQLDAVNRFHRLAEAIPECVWVLDLAEKRMTFVSSAYERIWGRRVQDLLDDRMDWLQHIHPDDQARMKKARDNARLGGLDEEFRVVRPDGSIRWLHLTTFPILGANNRVQSIGGVASDITSFITQRNELSTSLIEQRHRAEVQRFILDALPANIALIDESGKIIEVNASWQKLVLESAIDNYSIGDFYLANCDRAAGKPGNEKARELESFAAEVRAILAGGNATISRIYPSHTVNQQRWFRVDVSPLHTEAKRGAVVMHVEITESMLAEQRLLQLSHYDSLTMLPNRLLFRDRLMTALALARRNGTSLAVCFIDLDRFKAVNDSLGHLIGDQLLLEVSNRLKICVRDCDTVSRLGGDEFALILPELADQQDSALIAERVIQALTRPITLAGNELFITASMGITLFPADTDEPDILLRNADTAMYRAKEMGRNNFQFFTAEMNTNAMEAMKLERDLRHAIEHREFMLYYQPKVSCTSGKIVGFEALLRWQHPLRGLVSPAEFVPLLEETGMIVPVGAWVLNTACAQAKAWQDAGLGALSVAVNVSGQQMHQNLCETVRSALADSGLAAEFLELELTESYLMRDAENIIATLRKLKSMGVTISVDDFGTGYSSLAYLKRFPLDSLKVDRAFVQDITADPNDVSITRAIITLAHSFNLQVIAEGVETEGQLNLLIANQCDVIQGYYFSRPLPVAEITVMLREGRNLSAKLLNQERQLHHTLLLTGGEENILPSLQQLLNRDDYTIFAAGNAAQSFELLASKHIDVIISGEDLPDMSGIDYLRRVKTLHPETMRMLLADHTDPQAMTEAINEKVLYKFLSKPWDDSLLHANVEEAFRQRAIADENRLLQSKVNTANQELAQLNEQLKRLLAAKEVQVQRNEAVLDIAQEVLQNLPWPVIGVDNDNMIAFANAAADALCAEQAPLLASFANETLPQQLCAALAQQPTMPPSIVINGVSYRLTCDRLGASSHSSGTLILLLPETST